MVTMGHSTIINASHDIMLGVRKEFEGKTRDEVFNSPLVYGVMPYFLPDIGKLNHIDKPAGFDLIMLEKDEIKNLYSTYGAQYGFGYDENSPNPEILMIMAKYQGEIAGAARAKADSKTMWSIDVDVFDHYKGKGLAAPMVNMLAFEILSRGYIPYYFAGTSNVLSIHVAVRAGFIPAWVHCYKTRLDSRK